MFNKRDRNEVRKIRHERVRKKISGTPERPRLCVFRSNKHIYAQIIDDVAGILQAGTPMPAGRVHCDYECEVTLSDLDDQGNIHLRLYSRPKGMEHIQSTLEPEGGRIRYMGAIELPLPPRFKLDEDHLLLHLTVALDDSINVLADHLVPKNKLFSKKGSMTAAERSLEAEFHPVI